MCIKCRSTDTEFFEEDGEYKKKCNDCEYVGGPYTSSDNSDTQTSLLDF